MGSEIKALNTIRLIIRYDLWDKQRLLLLIGNLARQMLNIKNLKYKRAKIMDL